MTNNIDTSALYKIGYGLYVVTVNDGKKDNGLIINTVMQLTSDPLRVAVSVNKANYSHDVIVDTGRLNVNCLTTEAPFKVFQHFGFQSGRDVDKFADCKPERSENRLIYLPHYINAYFSLEVESRVDLGTHTLFICTVTESKRISDKESMTYDYYHKNVKPKPQKKAEENKKSYLCTICGYIHEGEMEDGFECPLCKHGKEVFEPIA